MSEKRAGDTGDASAEDVAAGPGEVEEPDEVRRRLARPGPDGREIEVLAARRGVTMRPGAVGGGTGGGGDLNPLGIVIGFVVELVLALVVTAVVEGAAEGRPWKVKVYRRHRMVSRRLHSEVLPRGVQPEARMHELLDEFAPRG